MPEIEAGHLDMPGEFTCYADVFGRDKSSQVIYWQRLPLACYLYRECTYVRNGKGSVVIDPPPSVAAWSQEQIAACPAECSIWIEYHYNQFEQIPAFWYEGMRRARQEEHERRQQQGGQEA